jgi:hypothetical protein
MKKEDISAIAQLLSSLKDMVHSLEEAQKKKDISRTNDVKKEILELQKQISFII